LSGVMWDTGLVLAVTIFLPALSVGNIYREHTGGDARSSTIIVAVDYDFGFQRPRAAPVGS